MENKMLRKAVAAALAGAALTSFAQQASAAQTLVNLGNFTGSTLSHTSTVPKYAWDGTNGLAPPPHNVGWNHTSDFFTFTISSPTDVVISMTSNAGGLNSAFSVWSTAGGYTAHGDGSNHSYDQLSAGFESTFMTSTAVGQGSGALNDKVTGWVGYANSGPGFTAGHGSVVYGGSPGASVTGGNAINGTTQGNASLTLIGLAAGQYLIGLGGSCYTDGAATGCGTGVANYTVAVSAVPIPAAVWLLGSALVGMGVIGRRKAMAGVA
jgi:hypothetical protein